MTSRCGSIVEITLDNLILADNCIEGGPYIDYYIGQTVIAIPSNLKHPKWIRKSRALNRSIHVRHRFIVQNLVPVEVIMGLHQAEGPFAYNCDVPYEDIPKLKALKIIDEYVPHSSECRLLKLQSTDVVMLYRDWRMKQTAKFRPENYQQQKCLTRSMKMARRGTKYRTSKIFNICQNICKTLRSNNIMKANNEGDESEWSTDEEEAVSNATSIGENRKHHDGQQSKYIAVQALCTDSKATIIWQDGTEEQNVPTTELYFSISLDDYEFFPGEWVIEVDKFIEFGEYGVVQKVDYLERTCWVKWFMYTLEEMAPPIFIMLNECSVYDLKKHPSFVFRPGSVVHRFTPCEENLGTVIDSYPQGYVKVKWMNGEEEDCWPHHIGALPELRTNFVEDTEDDGSMQVSWETESIESILGDVSSELTWQNLAARLDFIRSRIVYLKDALLRDKDREENFSFLKNLLAVYDNSLYLDKLLGTSFFSVKSKHYQTLLATIKEKAKIYGVEIKPKLPIYNANLSMNQVKAAERDNLNQVLKLESKFQQELGKDSAIANDSGEPSSPSSPSAKTGPTAYSNTNLCIEILSMLKCRMDLSYAEMISRIGGTQALSVLTKTSENEVTIPATSTPLPSFSAMSTPEDSFTCISLTPPKPVDCNMDCQIALALDMDLSTVSPAAASTPKLLNSVIPKTFDVLDDAPLCHRYFANRIEPVDCQRFFKTVIKETKLLKESVPAGVWVYSFANRMDLHSVMVRGPDHTPYEDGLFIFDLQMSADYPRSPPLVNYISYNSERLNPNLYTEGRVCVSLLGTWLGRGTEMWGPNSTLLQLIVSIQGLILVAEPYYNEAGYEKQSKSQQGYENSRTYNELVLLRLVQSMTAMLDKPHEVFEKEIYKHFRAKGLKMIGRMKDWIHNDSHVMPQFPLLPVSKGLKLSLDNELDKFQRGLEKYELI